ncbi:MAG: hypothetical protein Q7S03_03725 [bacterium]|nr:hypothetical protein [bacterium]
MFVESLGRLGLTEAELLVQMELCNKQEARKFKRLIARNRELAMLSREEFDTWFMKVIETVGRAYRTKNWPCHDSLSGEFEWSFTRGATVAWERAAYQNQYMEIGEMVFKATGWEPEDVLRLLKEDGGFFSLCRNFVRAKVDCYLVPSRG